MAEDSMDPDEFLAHLREDFSKKTGITFITQEEMYQGFATDNRLLPFMSFKEKQALSRNCGAKPPEPPLWPIRLAWWLKACCRPLTRRGRAADKFIKVFTKTEKKTT